MDSLQVIAYSSVSLIVFVALSLGVIIMEFVVNNWDTIMLIVTNVVALFCKPPQRRKIQ